MTETVATISTDTDMAENIFLFVPNLIGYVRIILMIVAFWYMTTDCVRATAAYLLSGLLDAFDGHAARALNQGTKFGAMLDQLTDRVATMCLTMVLCIFYPSWSFVFQMATGLDIASHWLHLHVAQMKGSTSHKAIDLDGNPILRIYYTNRKVLFSMCAGNELFFAMLYICHFTFGPSLFGVGLWQIVCVLSFPVAVAKAAISAIHLYAASVNIGAIDADEREGKRQQ